MNNDLPDYLSKLNKSQLEAVLHDKGNLLILAGAGSGKTRVITTKIAYLIREKNYAPESILAVTFTNKAAREMRERACKIEPLCERANLRTFHSFGAWFLRRNAAAAALDKNFTIYDDEDAATLLRSAFPNLARPEAKRISSSISMAKDLGLNPDSKELSERFSIPEFSRYFAEYQNRLKKSGNVDFGDLISLPVKILQNDQVIAARMRSRFRIILVDEYQDSNLAQFELLKALCNSETYVCVVGDDDQSIYAFRGAEIKNILTFPEVFPNTQIIKLEENYRSFQSILNIASAVVEKNEGRLGKTLKAIRKGGTKPVLAVLQNEEEECDYCTRVINEGIRRGASYSDFAILYRTNAQSRNFEFALPQHGIPFKLIGSLRFYEREEVKDILALLSLACNPYDEIAFRRIVNKPLRGIGEATIEALVTKAYETGTDYLNVCLSKDSAKSGKARNGLQTFANFMKEIIARLGSTLPLSNSNFETGWLITNEAFDKEPEENTKTTIISYSDEQDAYSSDEDLDPDFDAGKRQDGKPSLAEIVQFASEQSGLLEYHKKQDDISGSQKVANIDELVNAASDYSADKEGLSNFLEAIELDRSMAAENQDAEAVTLITMHNTKGLEFPTVFITGMEQGLFPRNNEQDEELEEQRRLFYVAITRAKNNLHLTYCKTRLYRGHYEHCPPSDFLADIPSKYLEFFGGKINLKAAQESSKWKKGQAVYHDDYGSGYIIKSVSAGDSGACVTVQFETGAIRQFFPKYANKLELIGD